MDVARDGQVLRDAPSPWTSLRLHAGAFALVLAGGLGTLGVRAFAPPGAVTVDDALSRYRATPPASAPPVPSVAPTATASAARASGAPARPGASARPGAVAQSAAPQATASAERGIAPLPEGVYVWATTGYEKGGAGPASQRHDYPERTTTIVRRDGCEASMRWEPVEDRWDDVVACHEATSRASACTTRTTRSSVSRSGTRTSAPNNLRRIKPRLRAAA